MSWPADMIEKTQAIKLFAMDVDGVLTNGDIIYSDNGSETKIFNVKDGHGLSLLRHHGIVIALITGRNSSITQRRAEELQIPYVFQGVKSKLPVLQQLVNDLDLTLSEVLYMGDDTPDIPVLEAVGLAACPADAVEEVKHVCHYTTKASGGHGAVREMANLILNTRFPNWVNETTGRQVSRA